MSVTTWAIVALSLPGLYALHRLLLWAERRGWIYYSRQSGSHASVGSALLEVHALMEPSKRHVLEVRDADERRDDDADDTGGAPVPDRRCDDRPIR